MSNLPSSLVPEPRTQIPSRDHMNPSSLSCRLRTRPTSCASGIHSLQKKICVIISIKKQKQQNIFDGTREKKKSSFLFELVLQHGMELCLTEPSLTARHVEPQPALWTGLRSVYQLRPVIGCPHRVRPSDDVRLRVGGMSQQFLVWFLFCF